MRTTHASAATGTPPANRAERRAAARGKRQGAHPSAPRVIGPREHTTPAHARADFVARRGG